MFDLSHFNHIEEHVYVLNREDDRGNTSSCMVITGGFSDAVLEAYAGKIDYLISMSGSLISASASPFLPEQSIHINAEKAAELQHVYERKSILLKSGHFCVEFLPEENGDNYEYLFRVKDMARKAGLEYYASVPWKKSGFIAKTGRKAKDTENIVFFTKGRARELRPDAKKDKQYENSRAIVEYKDYIPGGTTVHYSDMGGMGSSSETSTDPIDVDIRLSVSKEDADKVRTLLEKAWDDATLNFFDKSPLDKDYGGSYSLEELFEMPVQEYMLRYLASHNISYVDLSPGVKDIFRANTEVIVNPTNLIGPMGAGLAKSFKEHYSELEGIYKECCRQGKEAITTRDSKIISSASEAMREGDLFLYDPENIRVDHKVLCFPTKRDWKDPSDLALIEAGLKTFVQNYKKLNIASITFPKLGCGLGGLNWEKEVKPLMQKYLGNLPDLNVQICGDTLKVDRQEHFMSGAAGMLPTEFSVAPVGKGEKIHQAEKPRLLLEQILKFVTLPGETALDQFAGSGVLGEAALNTGRNSILIEKDAETFEKMAQRLQALGNIEASTSAAKKFVSVGTDALVAQDAFNRTGDRDILYNFAKTHDLTDISVFYEGEKDLRREATPEQAEAVSRAFSAIEDVDLRSHDLDLTQASQELSDDKNISPSKESNSKVLECSSRGDRRFSALFAKVTIKGKERSIEEFYQDAKRTVDGKKAGKGKSFDHIICPFTGSKLPACEANNLYKGLWITYFTKNPDLVEYAKSFDEFHDMFRGKNTVNCQADVISAYMKDQDAFVSEVKRSSWYQNMASKMKKPLSQQIQSAQNKSEEQMSFMTENSKPRNHWQPSR